MPRVCEQCLMVMLGLNVLGGMIPTLVGASQGQPEKLDCRVHDVADRTHGPGVRVAAFAFEQAPRSVELGRLGMEWDKTVRSFIDSYVDLCEQYNSQRVSKEDYGLQLSQLEEIYKESQPIENKLREMAQGNVEALERSRSPMSDRPSEMGILEASISQVANRIEVFGARGRPLKPSSPCPLPDMLGSPGVQQDAGRKC